MQRYMQRYGGDKEAARHRYWNHCRPCKEDPWLAQRARTLGVRALGYKDFEAYLAGPHWQSFRERALEEQRTRLQRISARAAEWKELRLMYTTKLTSDSAAS